MLYRNTHMLFVFGSQTPLGLYCLYHYLNLIMPPRKKLKPLEGQTKLSFAKSNKESQQEQEAVTAIDKDDATANEEKAQGKSKEARRKGETKENKSILVFFKCFLRVSV